MDYSKKHLFSSCAIGLCAVCAVALAGCYAGQHETYDNQTQNDTAVQNNQSNVYVSSIPVVYEKTIAVNPYETELQVKISAKSDMTLPCLSILNRTRI